VYIQEFFKEVRDMQEIKISEIRDNLLVLVLVISLLLCGFERYAFGIEPIAHWRFDEVDGNTAYDSSGTAHGTVHGAEWTLGVVGGALYFDGVDDYVELPDNNPVWLPQGDFALSVWVYFYKPPFGDQELILDLNFAASSNPGNELGYNLARRVNTSNASFSMTTTTNPDDNLYGNTVLVDDKWYHIVALRNGTTQSLYIDGQLDASRTCSPDPVDFVGGYDDNKVNIGRHTTAPGGPHYFLNGLIDEVMIFDQSLSAEEIRQLFESPNTIAVVVDIKPDSCPNPLNLSSRGVLPVAVLGTDAFDVSQIDIASIRLAGVGAVRSSLEDVSSPVIDGNDCECGETSVDGFMDLMLKFRTEDIVESLINIGGELEKGEQWELDLTGQLLDGTPIEGSDCVTLVGNVSKALAARKTDVNDDGIVNMADFAVMTQFWLEPAY
jgi:hypothetical protein